MTPLPPGFVRTPNTAAAALIWLAARPLPPVHRNRYYDEFRAEVCSLPGRQQVTEAASVLAGSFRLSRALQEDRMTTDLTHGKPIGCRLGHHHYQTVSGDNAENRKDRHKECVHCGKVKEMDMYEPTDGRYLGGLPS
jgi:hypothetical protein